MVKTKYNINLNHLCQTKFHKSADKVICGYNEGEMAKSKNTLNDLYNGKFHSQKRVREEFAQFFGMSNYYEFESYVKYGPHGKNCPLGFSAEYLRTKFEREHYPNLDILCPYLQITKEEWEDAISGKNEFCYYAADALELYFDLIPGTLRGIFPIEQVDNFQHTYCFIDYPMEATLKEAVDNGEDIEEYYGETNELRLLTELLGPYKDVLIAKEDGGEVRMYTGQAAKDMYVSDED